MSFKVNPAKGAALNPQQ
uniref:Uncharacterized protein n=1 Tax=Anguilla anguilla TaxID=7936 RepID=A0A0E9TWG5_ANGAN